LNKVIFSPVSLSMANSSLGYAAARAGLSPCDRAWLPEGAALPEVVGTVGSLYAADAVFVSCAWELEVPRLVSALAASGIEPFADSRPGTQPLVIGGGPLTLSNPDLLAAVCDAVFIGEADRSFKSIDSAIAAAGSRRDALDNLVRIPGMWVPASGAVAPIPITVRLPESPLHSGDSGSPNEFSDAFIVEVGRGCPRGCRFCVAFGGRRASFYPVQTILDAIPEGTKRAGLLGAAVSDHPGIVEIVRELSARDTGVTLGSLRADRVKLELVRMLADGGLRTLTVAADGSSQRMRDLIAKGITADHLNGAADVARACGIKRLRVYVMIGLPGETDDDMAEFAALVNGIARDLHVIVSVSPFVPKRFTAFEGTPFAGVPVIRRAVSRLGGLLDRRVEVRAGSARQAEVEHRLSTARLADVRSVLSSI